MHTLKHNNEYLFNGKSPPSRRPRKSEPDEGSEMECFLKLKHKGQFIWFASRDVWCSAYLIPRDISISQFFLCAFSFSSFPFLLLVTHEEFCGFSSPLMSFENGQRAGVIYYFPVSLCSTGLISNTLGSWWWRRGGVSCARLSWRLGRNGAASSR